MGYVVRPPALSSEGTREAPYGYRATPDGAIRVPLTRGAFALIDAADADAVLRYSWHLHSSGYTVRHRRAEDGLGSSKVYIHHSILNASDEMLVRRRPGTSRLDNRRATLRLATLSQSRAGFELRRDNASGYRGVTWAKRRQRWQAPMNHSSWMPHPDRSERVP